ncbi:MAG: aldo/keto reductase [Sandaracinaceae bacterium]|nr:aldo/keto reductase [Myxococcales bacterium]MCB9660948.1 aldo/keto reductase [Sandaracinaceae bacterium]
MDYVFLGGTGIRVSELCFGTMSFGGDANEETSAALYARCREAGINFFDTADVYSGGASERILGKLMAHERDALVIASKAYFPTGPGPNDRGSSRYHLTRTVEASLKRLGTDRLDLLYLHRFDERTQLEETLRGVELLVQQGKVLHPAISNWSAWQTMQALGVEERHGWAKAACLQPMYNLVKRQAEVEILPMAQAMGLGVCPYSPLGGGLLSGKYTSGASADGAPSGRIRDNAMYASRYGDPREHQTAEAFAGFARDRGLHPVSLAVAWVGSHPAVTCPILGARSVAQLEPALASVELDMTAELRAEVSALSPAPPLATDRAEEAKGGGYGTR